jgi:hypothetical protein
VQVQVMLGNATASQIQARCPSSQLTAIAWRRPSLTGADQTRLAARLDRLMDDLP